MLALFTSLFAALFSTLLNLNQLAENPFPEKFVSRVSGHFMPGGLVAMQLQDGVSLRVDGRVVASHNGLAVFGYGRDRYSKAESKTTVTFEQDGKAHVFHKSLEPRSYDVQYVEGVAPKYVTPPEDVLARIKAEGKQKRGARQSSLSEPTLSGSFVWPVTGRISGVYGSQRFFNGKPKRPHFGIDIAAPKGTPVIAMQAGRVTLAERDMYYEGGLIFIDHGLGVISAYLHLSAIKVQAGQMVQQGDIIGKVGSVGRSTGAHLDWRVYWRDQRLDPALLVPSMSIK